METDFRKNQERPGITFLSFNKWLIRLFWKELV